MSLSPNTERDEDNDGTKHEQSQSFLQRSKSWIVLVDDEEPIRLALGDYLYGAGYSVTACADSEALLELLETCISDDINGKDGGGMRGDVGSFSKNNDIQSNFPSAIISDIRMPGNGMNGLQLLSILKQKNNSNSYNNDRSQRPRPEQQKWRNSINEIPIILLSAKSMTQDRIEGYRLGADAYLTKPFDPEELLSIVDNLIRRREQQSAMARMLASESEEERKIRSLKEDMVNIKAILRGEGRGTAPPRRGDDPTITDEGNGNGSNGKSEGAIVLSPRGTTTSSALAKSNKSNRTTRPKGGAITKSKTTILSDLNDNVSLTPSETEVLKLLSKGYTNKEIATARGSSSAVGVSRILSKLYVKTSTKTRTELVRWAIKRGYVPPR